jgi:hypothetical protein
MAGVALQMLVGRFILAAMSPHRNTAIALQ